MHTANVSDSNFIKFVAVTSAATGPGWVGDVVVFQPERINGGQLTTHRVVDETEQGFITRDDANLFANQSDGEPPVKRTQVVATALQMNGNAVVIPNLGDAVEGIQANIETVQRPVAALLGVGALVGCSTRSSEIGSSHDVWIGAAVTGTTRVLPRATSNRAAFRRYIAV